jgi:hypothetical protein
LPTRQVTSFLSLLKNLIGVPDSRPKPTSNAPSAHPVVQSGELAPHAKTDSWTVRDIVNSLELAPHATAPVLVTGAAGSGKSNFVQQLSMHLSGCVVHLHQAYDEIAGFADAPLMGNWRARGAVVETVADLDDVLRTRPSGYFNLEMPPQAQTQVDMHDLLSSSLMSGVTHWEAARASRPLRTLTLIVEDSSGWLFPTLTTRLLDRGRAWQLRLVQVDQRTEHTALWANLGHLVTFKTAWHDPRLCQLLGVSSDVLRGLPAGECFHRHLLAPDQAQAKHVKIDWTPSASPRP